MWYFTWFPDAQEEYYSFTMEEHKSKSTPVDHITGKFGEVSAGPGIDQDVGVWESQQQGLASRGFKGDYMPNQERRIRYHHESIDRYIDGTHEFLQKK